jgi:hypothetical protein
VTPTIGRILHYRLTEDDADRVNRRRTNAQSIAERLAEVPPSWPRGAQAHFGDPVKAGVYFPMVVVRVSDGSVNGQVLLDGNDVLWVSCVGEGTRPGSWCWPPRAAVGPISTAG